VTWPSLFFPGNQEDRQDHRPQRCTINTDIQPKAQPQSEATRVQGGCNFFTLKALSCELDNGFPFRRVPLYRAVSRVGSQGSGLRSYGLPAPLRTIPPLYWAASQVWALGAGPHAAPAPRGSIPAVLGSKSSRALGAGVHGLPAPGGPIPAVLGSKSRSGSRSWSHDTPAPLGHESLYWAASQAAGLGGLGVWLPASTGAYNRCTGQQVKLVCCGWSYGVLALLGAHSRLHWAASQVGPWGLGSMVTRPRGGPFPLYWAASQAGGLRLWV